MRTAQWLYAVHLIFIEWGVGVFELRGAPFWSQTFCFAQTDGITEFRQQYYNTRGARWCDARFYSELREKFAQSSKK